MFSWRGSSNWNLSRKALGGSFLVDSSPITLLPSLPGTETWSSHWRTMIKTMIDVCPLLSMFCPINFLCCRRYYVPLHLLRFLRHQLHYFVDHHPFDILVCLHAVERTGTPTASHGSHMYKLSNKRSTYYVEHIAVLRVSSFGACLRKICKTRMGMKGDLCNLPYSNAGFGPDLEPVLCPVRSYPLTRLHL